MAATAPVRHHSCSALWRPCVNQTQRKHLWDASANSSLFFLTKRDLILESMKHSKNLNYSKQQVGMVGQACDPSTWNVKAAGFPWSLGHPGLESETLCSSLRSVSHRFTYASTRSPVGVAVWGGCGRWELAWTSSHWGALWEFHSLAPPPARSLSHGSGGRRALSVSHLSCLSLLSDVTVYRRIHICSTIFTWQCL